MSLLTPLYILGALAIAGPILFHLIRRRPQGEVRFSSLMFLNPTPPTLTRRSRLDHLLLLALRAAALGILALAFARPFVRQAIELGFEETKRSRVAVLIDTSASMRRGDAWARAKQVAESVIRDLGPNDEVAIYSFDRNPRTVFSLVESASLGPAEQMSVAQSRLDDLRPSWGSTNLGQALSDIAADLHESSAATETEVQTSKRIVLISDLQEGGDTAALNTFDWPADVELDVRSVPLDSDNAGLHLLTTDSGSDETEDSESVRIRVTNSAGSKGEQFRLVWRDERQRDVGRPVTVTVPAGESRVIRVEKPEAPSDAHLLVLEGDQQSFDNTLYFTSGDPKSAYVFYLGSEMPSDVNGHLYYLKRAYEASGDNRLQVKVSNSTDPLLLGNEQEVPLVVLAEPTIESNLQILSGYMTSGGTVLVVLASLEQEATLSSLAGDSSAVLKEGEVKSDILLQEIDFGHQLFAPFAAAQYNDFTRIRFWRFRNWDVSQSSGLRVVARFEGGAPALVEKQVGKGRLFVLTSGWTPRDSQLARSSKFVPLLSGLANRTWSRIGSSSFEVFDPIEVSERASASVTVKKPNGDQLTLSASESRFTETDEPGVYRVVADGNEQTFAVNLDPAESRTDPLDIAVLEQLGCRLVGDADPTVTHEQLRQMRNVELEDRQSLWRWLIVGAILLLIFETWLASRRTQQRLLEVVAK